MRLRNRFMLWFGLAALVPIAVAAMVTRQVVARSYRDEYQRTRGAAERAARAEVERLEQDLAETATALARREDPIIGTLLQDLVKDGVALPPEARRRLREQAGPGMAGRGIDVLTVVGPDDQILAAPHNRGIVGDPAPALRALATSAKVVYREEKIMGSRAMQTVLVAETARIAKDGPYTVVVAVGRAIDARLVTAVRRAGQIDTRIVDATGRELAAPAEAGWSTRGGQRVRIALPGEGATVAAWIEVLVRDRDLARLQRQVTLVAAVLAVLALGLTMLLGAVVARRITAGLDDLVTGAQAAAKGELEHRVPVTSTDELGEVAGAMNLMLEDLRTAEERLVIAERIAAWQEIARRLAHEIKNPLTPIQMAMDNLRKTWRKQHPSFGEILEESTATVLEESDRLRRIVSEFSDFARMPKADPHPLDLSEAVGAALALYQGETPVERRLAADLPPVAADRGQLTQVVLNLVENARDAIAGKPDGAIVVTTKKGDAGDRVELIVDDNGPGVAAELRDKVFAPYFTTKHGQGGTGLGLAIVHRIVSDHGGRIVIAEAPTGGARFAIELPLERGQPLLASLVKRP
ncbi:MAG: HAMP domain-containing protein [Myxococcales bacterium]|nr:HAMP domain-containing protein [Myxococcales bacterium]